MARELEVSTRNARFQQWRSLLDNRTKRHQAGEFIVQGVRPITLAVEQGWPLRALLYCSGRPLSKWALQVISTVRTAHFSVAPELMEELGEKGSSAPELLAVAEMPRDDLSRVPAGPGMFAVVLDRPSAPGNVGTVVRSADAFGATTVVVTGHGADPYDPKAVRASTGSLFSVPTLRAPGHREVLGWAESLRKAGTPVEILGTDEHGELDIYDCDLHGPKVVVVGNETRGLSTAWREACQHLVRIPIRGTASSLNASLAATIIFYEAARQRERHQSR